MATKKRNNSNTTAKKRGKTAEKRDKNDGVEPKAIFAAVSEVDARLLHNIYGAVQGSTPIWLGK